MKYTMHKFLKEKLKDGCFKQVPLAHSKMMSAVKGKSNKSTELKFCSALQRSVIHGWRLHEKLIGNPDIYFPDYEIAVFLDGCFWHGCPKCGHIPKTNFSYWEAKILKNKERDNEKTFLLKKEGYQVIRFWEHELKEDIERCVDTIKDAIEDRLLIISQYNDF